jgi:hypothetical protein
MCLRPKVGLKNRFTFGKEMEPLLCAIPLSCQLCVSASNLKMKAAGSSQTVDTHTYHNPKYRTRDLINVFTITHD